jgi:hypothetical protein
MKGQDASDYVLGLTGNTKGYKAPETASALVASGKPYRSSYQGEQDTLANQREIQRMQEGTKLAVEAQKPHVVIKDGIPIVARQGESYGQQASVPLTQVQGAEATRALQQPGGLEALPETNKKFIGAEPHADKAMNWFDVDPQTGFVKARGRTLDSRTDVTTGQPLPATAAIQSPGNAGASGVFAPPGQLGTTDKRDVNSAIRNAQSAEAIGTQILAMVDKDPNLVGPVGNARRTAQDFADIATNVINGVGGGQQNYAQTIKQAQQELVAKYGANAARILPQLFDPNLNSIETLNGFLVYRAAAAIGQEGRGASDKDIARVEAMVGKPGSWLQGAATYRSKVQSALDIVKQQRAQDEETLRRNNVLTPGGGTATPGADPLEGRTATGPDGQKIIRRGGQWIPLQ